MVAHGPCAAGVAAAPGGEVVVTPAAEATGDDVAPSPSGPPWSRILDPAPNAERPPDRPS